MRGGHAAVPRTIECLRVPTLSLAEGERERTGIRMKDGRALPRNHGSGGRQGHGIGTLEGVRNRLEYRFYLSEKQQKIMDRHPGFQ